jgi:hypothetical protein
LLYIWRARSDRHKEACPAQAVRTALLAVRAVQQCILSQTPEQAVASCGSINGNSSFVVQLKAVQNRTACGSRTALHRSRSVQHSPRDGLMRPQPIASCGRVTIDEKLSLPHLKRALQPGGSECRPSAAAGGLVMKLDEGRAGRLLPTWLW